MGGVLAKNMEKVMDDNMKKQQEFMLSTQKMQASSQGPLRFENSPPSLPPPLVGTPASDAATDAQQDDGPAASHAEGDDELVGVVLRTGCSWTDSRVSPYGGQVVALS